MSGALDVGISGLRAAQIGLSTTGHNITNASTPGYHRQEIVQSAGIALNTGSGFIGTGVKVDDVKRIYSNFLDQRVQTAQTQSSYLDTYSAQISQINNMVADPSVGLSPALQDFFKSVNDVAANPSSVPSRQSMISSAGALTNRFQTLNQQFNDIRTGVNDQITSSVNMINSYAKQIAEVNIRIVDAQTNSSGTPNDLLDQRDQLIGQLNQEVNVSVVKQPDGSYNVFMGQGQALVVGKQTYALTALPSLDDPSRMEVAYQTSSQAYFVKEDSLNSGALGGLLAFRRNTLDAAQNALGRVAIGMAQTFNDQHHLGQDLNGKLGGDFFAVTSPKVILNTNNSGTATLTPPPSISDVGLLTSSDYKLTATDALGGFVMTRLSDGATVTPASEGLTIAMSVGAVVGDSWQIQPTRNGARDLSVAIRDTAKVAAGSPIIAQAPLANIGSGMISAGVVNAPPPTNVNLQKPVTITFTSPTTFDVSSPTSVPPIALVGLAYTEGADISYNGWTVQITGSPAASDTFTISSNINGISDNRNALLLAGLQTKNILEGNTASYQSAYSQIVSSIGVQTRDISVTAQAQTSLVAQSKQEQQSLSGVNLDEEAANLLRYQQAYQAAGKMMQIASTMFDTLLALGK